MQNIFPEISSIDQFDRLAYLSDCLFVKSVNSCTVNAYEIVRLLYQCTLQ